MQNTHNVVLTSKRRILRGDLINHNIQSQDNEHENEAQEEKSLWFCMTRSNLVHLQKITIQIFNSVQPYRFPFQSCNWKYI